MVCGKEVLFSIEVDIYFLNGLPFKGLEVEIYPHMSRGFNVYELVLHHYYTEDPLMGRAINMVVIDSLLTQVVFTMVGGFMGP
jgi:hypothetical protein